MEVQDRTEVCSEWNTHEGRVSVLIKRLALSALAFFYISYISLTKTALNVLSCVEVHDSLDYRADHVTKHWAADTSVECFEGSHMMLALAIGAPLLAVFSVGLPAALTYATRSYADVETKCGWIYEVAGFAYRAYKQEYVYWEAGVMLRKSVLATVVVFAYPLGPNLQVALALHVLALALFLQTSCRPYDQQFTELNRIETFSIFVSLLTFLSSSFFHDDRVSHDSRVLATVCVTSFNAGLISCFVAYLFAYAVSYMEAMMDLAAVRCKAGSGNWSIVKTFVGEYIPTVLNKGVCQLSSYAGCKIGGTNPARADSPNSSTEDP